MSKLNTARERLRLDKSGLSAFLEDSSESENKILPKTPKRHQQGPSSGS